MPQQEQQSPPVVFTGLSLASNGGELPPGASPVFHNCDISPDGDVVRRAGSNYVREIDTAVSGSSWSQVIKTRKGTEYLVTVTQSRITIQLISESFGAAFARLIFVKQDVFSRLLTDVNFVTLSAPYDRLLILTPNHPPVQLSFLERTLTFTCTDAALGTITAPYVSTDTPLWRNNTVNGTVIAAPDYSTFYLLASKNAGFTMNVPTLGMTLNEVRELTLINISWQWWAEALVWKGGDFAQSTTRYNVTSIDQNVKIPPSLITDLDPQYLDSAYRGILSCYANNFINYPPLRSPSVTPATASEWSHGSGQRYNFAANNPLVHTPFFATWAAIEAVGVQSAIIFFRVRELRFNANTGLLPGNLAVYMDGKLRTWRPVVSIAHATGDYVLYADTYTTQRNIVGVAIGSTIATGFTPYANGGPAPTQAEFVLANTDTKWLGAAARPLLYTDLPVGGGVLDGCYVPAFGLGAFSDYLRGRFTPFGCLFRDRLVLKTADESIDQLVLSGTSDTLSPGNFYNFFQITDALAGTIDDPFNINITAKSREKITALLGWQQSLFVFTSVSTYSINGGELFGPDSYTTGLVSSYGAFNTRCVAATNLTVLFLNRFGLFDLLNKNNTTDYGSFERSEPVRSAFLDVVIPPNQDALPWLSLNDTNNKVYIGLPAPSDTTACKRILSLNLSWNSWSTIASAASFNACVGLQLLNWTMLVVKNQATNNIQVLQMDATHNLDYVVDFNNGSLVPSYLGYPYVIGNGTSNSLGVVSQEAPSPPSLREYTLSMKVGDTYYTTPNLSSVNLLPRNWMFDIPELAPLLGSAPEGLGSPIVLHHRLDPFPIYPRITARSATSMTFGSAISASEASYTTADVLGTAYPSIYASPSFNASSLGRLKRLKKLHLLFDNTSVLRTRYFTYPNKQLNSAIAVIQYNYGEGGYAADSQLVGDYLRFDALHLDTTPSVLRKEQLSIPLSGYGCDYQLFVCSTGGDAFKLTNYEFDIQPQRTKTYVRE